MSTTMITTPVPVAASDVATLLGGIARRDPAAWSEVVRRYGRLVLVTARSFRMQEADVLDAVQMTWVRLAENCRSVHQPEHLGGWLTTTARRECLHILRRTRRIVHAVDVVENTVEGSIGPEQRAIDSETVSMIRDAVAELPARRRDLVRALFADDTSAYAEIASRMDMPIGSIGPTRARTLRQLRCLLDDQGLTPGA